MRKLIGNLIGAMALLASGPVAAQEGRVIWQDLTTSMTEQDVTGLLGTKDKGSPHVYVEFRKSACYKTEDNEWCGALTFNGPGGTINSVRFGAMKQKG